MPAIQVEGIHLERVADEILAMKTGTLEAHALNQSAAAVFDLCDGKSTKAQMAAEIRRRTGLPADEEIVDLALAELVEAGLVVLVAPDAPSVSSRRSLIRRLALSSGAVMMLPVVETILMPHGAAAMSPPPSPPPEPTSTSTSTATAQPTATVKPTATRTPTPTPTEL